jgi:hypothetical protein
LQFHFFVFTTNGLAIPNGRHQGKSVSFSVLLYFFFAALRLRGFKFIDPC